MDFILLMATVICFVVNVWSDGESDVNVDISPLFLRSLKEPEAIKISRVHLVPSFMKRLYKRQNQKASKFSKVSCIFNKDYDSSRLKPSLLTFDLSSMVKLRGASRVKLRVFKRRSKISITKNMYYINLFQVILSAHGNSSIHDKTIVRSLVVDNYRSHWLTFDVTSQVQNFSSRSMSIHFLIDVKPTNATSIRPRPISIGKFGPKRPMLLVFYRKKRSKNMKKAESAKPDIFSIGMSRFPRGAPDATNKYCRRHRLYIAFKKLGWSNRIIAPRGYSAYYCSGKCSIVLGRSMNSTPYSVLRNLYKVFTQNISIPSACCVPTELKSTSILYFDENQNIVLKEFPNMAVVSCGCR